MCSLPPLFAEVRRLGNFGVHLNKEDRDSTHSHSKQIQMWQLPCFLRASNALAPVCHKQEASFR